MLKGMLEKIKQNKLLIAGFLIVLIVAVFLRLFHYGDFLRFGKDQARDAFIVQEITNGNQPLPLLGPKAGGTDFKMGPLFYYAQYASAKLFGFSPVTIAIPDLFISLCTPLLLFFFLRKYFNQAISFGLSSLYSVSFFAVQNGRFAWNPNSLLFFTLLFFLSLLSLTSERNSARKKIFWSILAGLALGAGAQMHTIFLVVMPIALLIFFCLNFKKTEFKWKQFLIIILVALFLNLPQITSEIQTGGANVKSFFVGIPQKSSQEKSFFDSVILTTMWHLQANNMFVIPFGDDSASDYARAGGMLNKNILQEIRQHTNFLFRIALGTLISLLGYAGLLRLLKKETTQQGKLFLQLTSIFITAYFLVLIPLSQQLVLRYFLMVEFVPLLLIGLIFKLAQDKLKTKKLVQIIFFLFMSFCAFLNIQKTYNYFEAFSTKKGDLDVAIFGEEKLLGAFVISNSKPENIIYFINDAGPLDKFIRPLSFFVGGREILEGFVSSPVNSENIAYFSMSLNTKNASRDLTKKVSDAYKVTKQETIGRLIIYKLELK